MDAGLRDRIQAALGDAYRLDRELGGGGMSRVFVAHEIALGRTVALKVLSPELAAGISIERFHREIQVAARLQHPHVVPVHSAGAVDGLPYYTMPFIEGESLRARLAKDRVHVAQGERAVLGEPRPQRLTLDERHRVIRQSIHGSRRVHGDHVRVLKARRDLDLAMKPLDADAGGEFRREHLQRDRASKREFVRDEHARHPAAAEFPFELVGTTERRLNSVAESSVDHGSL